MAVQVAANPRWSQNETGRIMSTDETLVHTSATWVDGEFLRLDGDGFLYEAVTNTTAIADSATTHYALSTQTAAGVTTQRKLVGVVAASDVYEVNELDGTVTEAMKGNHYCQYVDSNLFTLDVDNSTYATFQLVEPFWRIREFQDTSSDTLARALVTPLTTNVEASPS
jgi:hypothetical protein